MKGHLVGRSVAVSVLSLLAFAAPCGAQAAFDPTVPGQAGLAVGITEPDPNFLWPAEDRAIPEPFAAWRTEFAALRPQIYRLVLDWARLQRDPTAPADLDRPSDGCMRGLPPCLGWKGVREQLAALAAAQRRTGVQALVSITGTPAWAVPDADGGCVRETDPPRSRPPRDDALSAYRQLVRRVIRVANRAGAQLRYWTAWNEPNHPFFLTPQREVCDVQSPTIAVAPYLKLVRSLNRALARAPGDQEQFLGELASSVNGSTVTTGVGEFIAALPNEVVCASRVWLQHLYVGATLSIDAVVSALDAHACARPHAIWLTETGLGNARLGLPPDEPLPHDRPRGCQRLHESFVRWYEHPRVTAAVQYTFREDPVFRTGLVPASMDHPYRTLSAWQAWGQRPDPSSPPPTIEQACPTPTAAR
jgi:hypothetical protein